MMMKTIYTVGHSNHPIHYFLELLILHNINCVVDVRSIAASQYNPQFNKIPLQRSLREQDIIYLHFAREFGARQTSGSVLTDDGQVDFTKFQQTTAFQQGVERLKKGLQKGYKVALMCSEANPLECHRFSMVAIKLVELGYDLQHIIKDGTVVSHARMEVELMEKYKKKIPQPSLFEPHITEADQVAAAYRLHNADIGWRKDQVANKIKHS